LLLFVEEIRLSDSNSRPTPEGWQRKLPGVT